MMSEEICAHNDEAICMYVDLPSLCYILAFEAI
jgi:hypothetical protein